MNLETITPPQFEPVALADVYSHLRLDPTGSPLEHPDDDMLTRFIRTARSDVERITGRCLVRQKLRLTMADFCRVYLLRPPLIAVETVKYYDTGNVLQTLANDQWFVTDEIVPQLRLVDGAWPSLYCRPDSVRVDYWAGYPVEGSPGTVRSEQIANVPAAAVDAILIGVQLLYDELTPEKRTALENARAALLSPPLKLYVVG